MHTHTHARTHTHAQTRARAVNNSLSLLQKMRNGMGTRTGKCQCSTSTFEDSCGDCPVHRPESRQLTELTSGSRWERSEVLRSLRHCLPTPGQGRTSHRRSPGGRGAEGGSARRSFLKRRERIIVNKTNTGTVSKTMNTGRSSEKWGRALIDFPSGALIGFPQRKAHRLSPAERS